MHNVRTRILYVQVGTDIEVVDGCSVGDTDTPFSDQRCDLIREPYSVCCHVTIISNLLKVGGDILQKGTVTYETGRMNVTDHTDTTGYSKTTCGF